MEESGFRSGAGEASGGKKDFSLVRAARPVISREEKMRIPLAAGMLKRVEKFPSPAVKSFLSMLKEEKQKRKNQA